MRKKPEKRLNQVDEHQDITSGRIKTS